MTKPYELFSMRITPERKELFRLAGEICKGSGKKIPPKAKIVEKALLSLIKLKEVEKNRQRSVLEDVLDDHRPREKKPGVKR